MQIPTIQQDERRYSTQMIRDSSTIQIKLKRNPVPLKPLVAIDQDTDRFSELPQIMNTNQSLTTLKKVIHPELDGYCDNHRQPSLKHLPR